MCVYPFVSVYSDLVFKFDFKFKIKYAFFKKKTLTESVMLKMFVPIKNINRDGHFRGIASINVY